MSDPVPLPPRPVATLPDVRASDADRELVVSELRQHHAEGRLTLEELEERVGTAYRARTKGELVPVLGDLPAPPSPPAPAPSPWRRVSRYAVPVALVAALAVAAIVTNHAQSLAAWPVLGFFFFRLTYMGRGRRSGWGRPPDHPGDSAGRGGRWGQR